MSTYLENMPTIKYLKSLPVDYRGILIREHIKNYYGFSIVRQIKKFKVEN